MLCKYMGVEIDDAVRGMQKNVEDEIKRRIGLKEEAKRKKERKGKPRGRKRKGK